MPVASGTAPAVKKKAAVSLLGDRSLLPPAAISPEDRRQQQEAQQACLQLAQHLMTSGAHRAAEGAAADAGTPPAPPSPAAVLLLDCSTEPLTASLALQHQAEALRASASDSAGSSSRQALAQRAAAAALLRGDVCAALHVLLEHDALTADFVSLSAAAGGWVGKRACELCCGAGLCRPESRASDASPPFLDCLASLNAV